MSLRRLWATCRLDLAHNLRRPLFWIWILILTLVSWGFSGGNMRIQSGDSDVGGVKAFITSEFAIAQIMSVLILLFHSFFIAVGAGMSVLRDEELQVGPVLHATPLAPGEYVWGKFLAILISFVTILAVHVGLMAFFNHVTTNAAESEFIGPFVLGNYVRPAVIFGLPTILFLAGTTFWVGERFRRPILVFFAPVAVLLACVFFLWTWSPSWMPESLNRALMFLDPTGHRWLRETWLNVDKGAEFYNSASVGLDSVIVGSRALLMVIGIAGVIFARRHFSASLRGKVWKPKKSEGSDALQRALDTPTNTPTARAPLAPKSLGSLGMRSRRPGFLSGLLAVTRIEFRELLHSPGLYLFIPLIVLETIGGATFNVGPFDTTPLNTSGSMAVQGMGILVGFVCMLLLFYTVESLRREEGTGLAPLHHSTPVRSASILSGKALANALVGVLTIAASLLASLAVLAYQGIVPITLWPFLLVWCVVLLPTFLLWSTFVSLLYCLVRNRYTTYALALGALMWTGYKDQVGELTWVTNWPLWGTLQWSDMGLFELVREELILNRILALSLTLFFTVLTVKFFPRRELDATNLLLRLRPLPILKASLKLTPVLVPPIVLGLMLSSQIDAGFQGDAATKRGKDYWSKNVATWTDADIPDLAGVELELELFPELRSFEVRGTYRLKNEHEFDLPVIPVSRGGSWRRPDSLSADENLPADEDSAKPLWFLNGEPFEPEDAAGLMLFRLPEPLKPGNELTIGFHHSGEAPAGATENGGGSSEFILPSGVVLTSFSTSFVPSLGYNAGVGVDEDNAYDAKEFPEDHHEGITRSLFGGSFAPHSVSMRVTAPEAYRINGVGVLKSEEVADGKRTVLWETDAPVRFFNVVCGRWTEARGEEGTVIYHHPEHTYNIPEMLVALDGARKYYSEWFYPYPWQELKISEFPALAGYAQGFATNITFSEGIGFLTKEGEEDAAAPFMVTAHESAHQWWGNILTPGEGPGGNLLSEGASHFSTLLLFEQLKGPKARIAFAEQIEDQYGDRRQKDSERPLHRIDGSRPGDTTVTYDKAGWVFWMLLNHMGREQCLTGIQSFIAHYVSSRDHPVLEDFVTHMRPFAPDVEAYDAFVQQWFLDVVVPKYELEDVSKSGDEEAGWTVTLTLTNRGTGSMPIEVAASAGERFPEETEDEDESPQPYREARQTVTLGAGESTEVVIACPFEPELVVIDPDALVLMLGRKHARQEL